MTAVVISSNIAAAMYFDAGIAHLNKNNFHSAIINFEECLRWDPQDGLAHWYKSLAHWSIGDYVGGALEHEYRWKLCDWRWGLLGDDIYRVKVLPQWFGEDIRGKRILVYHEQGYGDGIMFIRYIPIMKSMGADVTVVMPPPLQRLVRRLDVEVLGTVPEDLSRFHLRHPIISSMLTFKETPQTVPGEPYFKTNWKRGQKKIGIVWSGRSRREFNLDKFLSMFDRRDYYLQSLQPGILKRDDVADLKADDFADTSDVIAEMDHVVGVDTGVMHLVGAMGHPSSYLVVPWACDWRWYNAKAWYPLMNVYRQPSPDDWMTPFSQVNQRIRDS